MNKSESDIFLKKLLNKAIQNQNKNINHRLPRLKMSRHQIKESSNINCMRCIYLYTTWEKKTPYGCKAHGFKSGQIPSQVVFSSSGQKCLLFKAK